ncbi:uncharacterized protein EDB91DRAFT_1145435 [Suillus paluster]|uniref:uncharacterized protein n=1 Tax=Suillus paluster TaxID=48578 RepID=UPI001B86F01C|nr:uncharacterized protein EDB91DRAFT_1145435 [Suillus paluster]KAG1735126.1 hypothetical protein EDB91DRAFT_1145435 [Suillus paluster]
MQRSQKFSSSSDSSPSTTPPGSHIPQLTATRPESKADLKPLFTQEPLALSGREKKPSSPPRKRRRQAIPDTPALSFDPAVRMIPTGRQGPPPQTPLSSQPTPISSTNESDWTSDEVDDPPPSDTLASKRPRTSSGSDESPQPPSYHTAYFNHRYADQHDSPLSGGSSPSPVTSYGSSPVHPHYVPDSDHYPFHQGVMGQNCVATNADYAQIRRVSPEVYRDPGYLLPQEGAPWPYCPTYPNNINGYRD